MSKPRGKARAKPEPAGYWMAPGQAARYLQIARTTLYACMGDGRLPYYVTPSGRRRIKRADLDALLVLGKPTPNNG